MSETLRAFWPVIAGFIAMIVYFFKTKEELKEKIHSLEMKIKDLEYKDQEQQQALDNVPNIFGVVNRLLEQKGNGNGDK